MATPWPFVSIVVPLYDEEDVVPLLVPELQNVLDALPRSGEVIFVNDGSRDRTLALLGEHSESDPRLRIIDLSRNFGHAAAIAAGLDFADGDAVVVMDGDLQDPPGLILEMVRLHREGYDVVHARRRQRDSDSWFKRWTARLYYLLLRAMTRTDVPANVADFRLMSREVVLAMRSLREHHRLTRALVAWVGFRQTVIEFDRPRRAAGGTKYPLHRMLSLAWDGVTSFSYVPLRLVSGLGLLTLLFGVGYAIRAAYYGWYLGLGVPGWTSIVILLVLLCSAILLGLGVLGEYVGRIYDEVKRRPLYFVKGEIGARAVGAPTRVDGRARPEPPD